MSRTLLDESLDLFAAPKPMRVYLELPDGSFVPAITSKMEVCNDIVSMRYEIHLTAIVDVPARREQPPAGFRDKVRAGIERARRGLPDGQVKVLTPEEIAREKARRQAEAEEKKRTAETRQRFDALELEE